MWISQKNENSQGQNHRQSQKKTRAQKVDNRIGLSFPKALRILTRNHFQKMLKDGTRLAGKVISIHYIRGAPRSKLGITVSRKYGKAHDRNRFKRVVREAYREFYSQIPSDMQIHVLPRSSHAPVSKQVILQDLSFLVSLAKTHPQK